MADYEVRVKITASDPKDPEAKYKPLLQKGEFVSRKEKVLKSKVEAQVSKYIKGQLNVLNPDLEFDIKVVKIERCNKKFIVVEDKV